MRQRIALAVLTILACTSSHAENVAWKGGRWFDGKSFEARTFYSVDGVLAVKRPAKLDRTVELGGKFVLAGFGDAHHHGIDGAQGLDQKIDGFLNAGIFYVKNPNVIPGLLTPEVRSRINRADSIDVSFSNGGLTASGGHPSSLHAFLAKRGVFPGLGPQDMEGKAYHFIDNERDLADKWPAILAGKPDFIKTYLLFSEEFEKRKDSKTGFKGLDPHLLKSIVTRAHASGLRVTTHIETAVDFSNAVQAGVDEIAHLPIPRPDFSPDLSAYLIDADSARLAAANGVTVVATVGKPEGRGMVIGGKPEPDDAAHREAKAAAAKAVLENQRTNLRTLAAAGVRIALGSDGISGEQPLSTSADAARYLHDNSIFDAATILRMWTQNTDAMIFPQRKIGRLEAGYEADFVVLNGDPIRDFANIGRIDRIVRHGTEVHTPHDRRR